ncbi:MAG TPA: hypothetical protein VIK55_04370 [Paludibacter sp.]
MANFLIYGLLFVAITVTLFLILREVMCWYWKINKIVENQEEQLKTQRQIASLLMKIVDSNSYSNTNEKEIVVSVNSADHQIRTEFDSHPEIPNHILLQYSKVEKLETGSSLNYSKKIEEGSMVLIDFATPIDGNYKNSNKTKKYCISNGVLEKILIIETYKIDNGDLLEVDCDKLYGLSIGCDAWINGMPAPDNSYKISPLKKITIVAGKISKI